MLRIQIETQRGQLQLQIKKPEMDLSIRDPKLALNPEDSMVQIQSTPGELEIDQSRCRYAHGQRTYRQFIQDFVQESKQKGLEAIAEISSDGERLSHIENKQNMIAQLASEALDEPRKQITIGTKERPYIKYHPGKLDISFTHPSLGAQYHPGDVATNLHRGDVKVELRPYPSIKIWVVESKGALDIQA